MQEGSLDWMPEDGVVWMIKLQSLFSWTASWTAWSNTHWFSGTDGLESMPSTLTWWRRFAQSREGWRARRSFGSWQWRNQCVEVQRWRGNFSESQGEARTAHKSCNHLILSKMTPPGVVLHCLREYTLLMHISYHWLAFIPPFSSLGSYYYSISQKKRTEEPFMQENL